MVAFDFRAIPRLHFPRVVHFSQEECPSTGETSSRRHTRRIKLAVAKIRITVPIAKDAIAIAPLALVERFSFFRCRSLKHDAPHGRMVKITQRIEVRFGMNVHGFPWREFARPAAIERKGETEPVADGARINDPLRHFPRRGKTGEDLPR